MVEKFYGAVEPKKLLVRLRIPVAFQVGLKAVIGFKLFLNISSSSSLLNLYIEFPSSNKYEDLEMGGFEKSLAKFFYYQLGSK